MVAISLYRGDLHKVSDVPRRWTCPKPTISLKDFRILLRRRNRALARLRSQNSPPQQQLQYNPNPNPKPDPNSDDPDQIGNQPESENLIVPEVELKSVKEEKSIEKVDDALVDEEKGEDAEVEEEKKLIEVNTDLQKGSTEDALTDVEKRKKEIKEKLENLKEKKHGLVQVLKQILNAEEQLKRQNSMQQGIPSRPPLPLQVDTTTDSGSVTRIDTPKLGSDGNLFGNTDGKEDDKASNHNAHLRHLAHTSITSPSSESQPQKPATNIVPHSARTSLGVTSSPSRFAPTGQGLSFSVSGTSYIASSPSPAASGGTSIFRDGRLPSPWN